MTLGGVRATCRIIVGRGKTDQLAGGSVMWLTYKSSQALTEWMHERDSAQFLEPLRGVCN